MHPVVAVVGPTATGKSDLAVELALRLDGEVVSADAMQLYRGMDIGTAKLTLSERRGVPHHQLDVLDVTQEASLAAYQQSARADLRDISSRGRVPILTGGSGLYVRAAVDVLEIPPTDPEVRAALEQRLAAEGTRALYDELTAADPVAGQSILPTNGRRIVRALEVIALTGRPFSAVLPEREYVNRTVQIGLRLDRVALDRRTDARVTRMWDQGFVAEVQRLEQGGLRSGRTASRAVGYAQVLAALDGRTTVDEARTRTAQATRRLIRRQESWFRRDPRIVWLPADAPDLVDRAIEVLDDASGPP
ncbi:MAG: tRNA (adenosine(37)-N6)-dimethylallyltransferase MiaA [Actinomycetales bacterium]